MREAFVGIPWIIVGDFNTLLFSSKKQEVEDFSKSMRDFSTFLNSNNLMDVELMKACYTSMNRILGDHNI